MFVVPCVLLGPEEAGASYAGCVYPSFRTPGPPLSNNESLFASALAPHRPLISLQFCSQSRPITLSYNPQCNNIGVCSTVNYRRVSACDLWQLDRSARSGGNWSDWSIRVCATCPSHTLCPAVHLGRLPTPRDHVQAVTLYKHSDDRILL